LLVIAKKLLTVEGDVQDVVCLDEVYILVKQLDAVLVVQNCDVGLLPDAKTLACLLFNVLQGGPLLVAKLHHVLIF
jgi:hypothetical protein